MSASVSGVLSEQSGAHHMVSAQSANLKATSSNVGSSSGSASVSANDFLTLLVTEMKNQDPTANTDPNEYINQLVQVNSLEQLISINQTLSAGAAQKAESTIMRDPELTAPATDTDRSQARYPDAAPDTARRGIAPSYSTRAVHGNLTIPSANPAAEQIARSLGISSRVQ